MSELKKTLTLTLSHTHSRTLTRPSGTLSHPMGEGRGEGKLGHGDEPSPLRRLRHHDDSIEPCRAEGGGLRRIIQVTELARIGCDQIWNLVPGQGKR